MPTTWGVAQHLISHLQRRRRIWVGLLKGSSYLHEKEAEGIFLVILGQGPLIGNVSYPELSSFERNSIATLQNPGSTYLSWTIPLKGKRDAKIATNGMGPAVDVQAR